MGCRVNMMQEIIDLIATTVRCEGAQDRNEHFAVNHDNRSNYRAAVKAKREAQTRGNRRMRRLAREAIRG